MFMFMFMYHVHVSCHVCMCMYATQHARVAAGATPAGVQHRVCAGLRPRAHAASARESLSKLPVTSSTCSGRMRRCRLLLPQLIRSATPKRKPRITQRKSWPTITNHEQGATRRALSARGCASTLSCLSPHNMSEGICPASRGGIAAIPIMVRGGSGSRATAAAAPSEFSWACTACCASSFCGGGPWLRGSGMPACTQLRSIVSMYANRSARVRAGGRLRGG